MHWIVQQCVITLIFFFFFTVAQWRSYCSSLFARECNFFSVNYRVAREFQLLCIFCLEFGIQFAESLLGSSENCISSKSLPITWIIICFTESYFPDYLQQIDRQFYPFFAQTRIFRCRKRFYFVINWDMQVSLTLLFKNELFSFIIVGARSLGYIFFLRIEQMNSYNIWNINRPICTDFTDSFELNAFLMFHSWNAISFFHWIMSSTTNRIRIWLFIIDFQGNHNSIHLKWFQCREFSGSNIELLIILFNWLLSSTNAQHLLRYRHR